MSGFIKTGSQATSYGAMRAKLLMALDGAADDLDMAAAMDTMRGAASKMSRDEWDAMYDQLNGQQ